MERNYTKNIRNKKNLLISIMIEKKCFKQFSLNNDIYCIFFYFNLLVFNIFLQWNFEISTLI